MELSLLLKMCLLRQILDAFLIANKYMDSKLRVGHSRVLCKLDMEKACLHVNWEFLLSMLERMGFGAKWRKWIEFCISLASFSILVNGVPCGFFKSS